MKEGTARNIERDFTHRQAARPSAKELLCFLFLILPLIPMAGLDSNVDKKTGALMDCDMKGPCAAQSWRKCSNAFRQLGGL